jgi:hypothetical protein
VLARLVWLGPDDPEFGELFEQLRALLAGHSAWQEDQLFTTAAETLSAERLAQLCDDLVAFDAHIPAAA